MDMIRKALQDLKYSNISPYVLELVFNRQHNGIAGNVLSTIEYEVIRERVLVDMNIVGGTILHVRMSDCQVTTPRNRGLYIDVPKHITGNRTIISANVIVGVNMDDTYAYGNSENGCHTSPMMTQANKLISNTSAPPVDISTTISVISETRLYVQNYPDYIFSSTLELSIADMSNLENISQRNQLDFSKLVRLAVESAIYKELSLGISRGQIYHGHSLDELRSIISDYGTSNEEYLEMLDTKWRVVAYMNDKPKMSSYVKSLFGNV